jgi:hypothetical protein
METIVLPACCARCNAQFDLKIVGWYDGAPSSRQVYHCVTCGAVHVAAVPGQIIRVVPRVVLRPSFRPKPFSTRRLRKHGGAGT